MSGPLPFSQPPFSSSRGLPRATLFVQVRSVFGCSSGPDGVALRYGEAKEASERIEIDLGDDPTHDLAVVGLCADNTASPLAPSRTPPGSSGPRPSMHSIMHAQTIIQEPITPPGLAHRMCGARCQHGHTQTPMMEGATNEGQEPLELATPLAGGSASAQLRQGVDAAEALSEPSFA